MHELKTMVTKERLTWVVLVLWLAFTGILAAGLCLQMQLNQELNEKYVARQQEKRATSISVNEEGIKGQLKLRR